MSAGADVRLVALGPEHVPGLRPMLRDRDTVRFTRFPAEASDEWLREWLDRYLAGRSDGSCAAFAGLDPSGTVVGIALAVEIDRAAGEAELGYIVAPAARGRGLATALLRALTEWALEEQGLARAYLVINVENAASERVAVRAGYRREGVMRSVFMRPGVRVDAGLWSRLPGDPPPDAAG